MNLITWKDSYSVQVAELDAQHKRLIDLINELHHAMSSGKGKEVLEKTVSSLAGYTRYHFAAEEKMLTAKAYPGLGAHKIEHEKFTRQIMDFQKGYESGKLGLSISMMQFLREWLVNHILVTDKNYSPFLTSKAAD